MESFSTHIPDGADLWELRRKIANQIAEKRFDRPLGKKEFVYVTHLRENVYYITAKGVWLGNLVEVEDLIIFEPNNPGVGHHGIKK